MANERTDGEHSKAGRKEAAAALAVGFICLVIGVPLWWRTTTTYRASLPYGEIAQVFTTETVITVPITVISCSSKSGGGQHAKAIAGQLQKFLRAGKDGSLRLYIDYSIYPRDCLTSERTAITKAASIKDLDTGLHKLQHGAVGNVYVYALDDNTFGENAASVYMGSHRNLFIKDNSRSVEAASALVRNVLVREESLYKHYRTARGVASTVADLESMRSFRYKPGYELSFTLLVLEPHNILAKWDLDQAQKVFLDPILHKLREFAEFTVSSQVVYYMSLSVKPKQSPGKDSFYFPQNSLPHIITPIEAKLGSHVTNFPNLNFVVYVPLLDQTPLYIHSSDGEPVNTNAFLSPRWGGVLIHNGPTPNENASKPIDLDVDNNRVMPVFLAQLRLLLGIPIHSEVDAVFIEKPGEISVLDWEYDSLLRRHSIENLASASATLSSLSQLLGRISNIVIHDDVAKQVYTAVESIQDGHRYLRDGKLQPAFHASKRALIAAEKAFFDQSLLELLYFPEDQKFAIYIPLFLPVSIPVVMSMLKALRWFKQHRRISDKQKTD